MLLNRGTKVSGLSYGAIELIAMARRHMLGVRGEWRVDCRRLLQLFERGLYLHTRATRMRLPVELLQVSDDELDGAEATTTFTMSEDFGKLGFEIRLSERAYCGLVAETPHFVFTFAHELGHLFLHHDWLINDAVARTRPGGVYSSPTVEEHRVFEDSEWQADAFAGAFLMPAWLISDLKIQDPDVLARVCGVSEAAATKRLDVFESFREDLLLAWEQSRRLGSEAKLERRPEVRL